MPNTTARCFILTALLVLTICPVAAQAAAPTPPGGDLKVTLAPYAWLTGLSGTVGVRGAQTTVDSSFADLSKYLNIAGMLHADILYRDTFGLLGEVNYAQLGDQSSGKRVSLDGQMGLFLSDVAGFWRVGTAALGKDGAAPASLDLLAGARIWSLAMHLKSDSPFNSRSIFRQKSWVDPFVGARVQFQLTDAWKAELRGGVGGFGISSAITWDAMALVGYTFRDHGTAFIGYRAVGVNHSEGSGKDYFKFDAVLSGPVLGAAFTF
ncbi:hypothetical protein NNJEOMEG_01708 [Fundidesulfovibrio magnetotacticus]|uniref:Outer membrane protein beta-barrel domain-containing protein n=1 Tax=Fundidesulfovibrio magnetotacticus TaxID=2730080 RepID=A0A6V8LSC2_9BACT|nr:hypothetical protein [Fundidesulfovibrio magnetotacticus]GFK93870.1 hypothetical protein NNJEOMEG_01708 [Fundidesulfovibrio magnetotacticus]